MLEFHLSGVILSISGLSLPDPTALIPTLLPLADVLPVIS